MTKHAQIFARITKVDEAKRTVTGRAVQEVPDKAGEVFDYATSKPHFEKWVSDSKDASGGKSLGNIRAMHGNVAAGKAVGLEFNDVEKAIDLEAKIVDDQEWKKVLEGVYTGFSIGGSYVKKWADPDNAKLDRYTAKPTEISLVDSACVPTATFFSVHKADGTVLQKAFKPKEGEKQEQEEGDEVIDDAKAKEKKEVPTDGKETDQSPAKGSDNKPKDAVETDDPKVGEAEKVAKSAGPDDEEEDDTDLEVVGTPEDLAALQKTMAATGISIGDVNTILTGVLTKNWSGLFEATAAKATFADKANKRFPLDTEPQIQAAYYYVRQDAAKAMYSDEAEYAKLKETIDAAYDEKFGKAADADALQKRDTSLTEDVLNKSFYLSAQFCAALDSLSYMVKSAEYQYTEMGKADLAVRCKLAMASLAQVVCDMMACDVEACAKVDSPTGLMKAKAEALLALCEVSEETIAKIGSRNSKSDMERIQKVHDAAVELSARCSKKNPSGFWDDEEEQAKAAGLTPELYKMLQSPDKGEMAKALGMMITSATQALREELAVLKQAPVVPRVRLRAISKSADVTEVTDTPAAGTQVDPVRKSDGQVDEVATLIKVAHQQGGQPIFKRNG